MDTKEHVDPRVKLVQKALDEAISFLIANYPAAKQISLELVETIFVPKTIAKQLVLLFALETGMVTLNQITSIVNSILGNFSSRTRLIRQLREEQRRAPTQDEWMDLAEKIDCIQGNDVWRSDPSCQYYERDRISARIDEYVHLMRRQDIFELMFVLRGSIGRNKFGLLHEGLFNKALAGSKMLVETYHNVVCAALDFVCDSDVMPHEDPIPTDARLAFFNETRHSYGRTALLLSGGASLGFYHTGVVRTLMANNLMPRVLGGSSAGSIVCSMIGTRTDEECINDLFEVKGTNAPGHSGKLNLNFFRPINGMNEQEEFKAPSGKGSFWEVYYNTAGAFRDLKRTLQGFVPWPLRHFSSFVFNVISFNTRPQDLFKHDTNYFRECVKSNIGDFTFQEAFDRTGRILNIVVTPLNKNDPPRLLNYLTAPHVLVWSAAVASSSLPGVFEANRLVVKEADGWERYESGARQAFSDGSMEADLPMQQLSEMFNVNHFIISQANPHAVMFASYNQKTTVWTSPLTAMIQSVMTFLKDQARQWLANLVECIGLSRSIPFLGDNRGLPTQFLTQEYEGRSSDISLIPWLHHRSLLSALLHIIYNPSEAEFREWIQAAERETWRHIPAIKSHIAEEITLDRCVQRLRKRLALESWQKQSKLSSSTGQKLGERVPSFFASPSLANLGGLGITDQPSLEGLRDVGTQQQQSKGSLVSRGSKPDIPEIIINPGWAGMGLRGNRSSGNLARSASDASGLFIDDEEGQPHQQQEPGETHVEMPKKMPSSNGLSGNRATSAGELELQNGYLKTSSMARFYYRKTGNSHGSTGDLTLPTTNAGAGNLNNVELLVGQQQNPTKQYEKDDRSAPAYERRKSKSYGDLGSTLSKVKFEDLKE
mmetsp:Transcript_8731/g.18118  ORF Transcript_8731/g.18118 Transcript_8731/m.18118 type:complete len:883 (-) Transcript_8731:151-2799(-)